MSIWDDLKASSRRGALKREAAHLQHGLLDPQQARSRAATWALLRNELAPRCVEALLDDRGALALQLARRWKAADDRARAAQEEGNRREAAVAAYLQSHTAEDST